jgi:hypothetical protein
MAGFSADLRLLCNGYARFATQARSSGHEIFGTSTKLDGRHGSQSAGKALNT